MARKFAAKYHYKWQGWVCIFFGVGGLSGAVNAASPLESAFSAVFGLLLLALGVFLLRGQGNSPAKEAKLKAAADALQAEIDSATASLAAATGGAAVIAYRNLEALVSKLKTEDAGTRMGKILNDIKFEATSIQSPLIGNVALLGWGNQKVEIYRDWIISGQQSFDVDISTRAEVHIDGGITYDSKNNKIDNRTATLQFVSTDWATSFKISPDGAVDARTLVAQLMAVIESLKPKGVTSADISALVQTLLNNTEQPAAQKLQQLSDLRYQRLLTDEEFEAAKAKVLGI